MNALIVLSAVFACSQAQLLATPYAAGLGYGAGLPYAAGLAYGANYGLPLAYNQAPIAAAVAPAPIAPVAPLSAPSSQFQAQDEFGNINYGYSNINSAKQETGNTYGGVVGSYSYIDANGIPQRTEYIADAAGFRVKSTNLPVAPAVPAYSALEGPVFTGVAPAPVEDTPEVKAAKAEFAAAFDEALAREKRDADSQILPAATLPLAYNALPYNTLGYNGLLGYNNLAYNGLYGYNNLAYNGLYNGLYNGYAPIAATYAATAAPVAAAVAPVAATYGAAPAAREAVLTKIKLNPGHAVAYRVD